MYSLIVLKPFSLKVVDCVICDNMLQVLEAAENIEPNLDASSLFFEDCQVETENFIFKLANPRYASNKLATI